MQPVCLLQSKFVYAHSVFTWWPNYVSSFMNKNQNSFLESTIKLASRSLTNTTTLNITFCIDLHLLKTIWWTLHYLFDSYSRSLIITKELTKRCFGNIINTNRFMNKFQNQPCEESTIIWCDLFNDRTFQVLCRFYWCSWKIFCSKNFTVQSKGYFKILEKSSEMKTKVALISVKWTFKRYFPLVAQRSCISPVMLAMPFVEPAHAQSTLIMFQVKFGGNMELRVRVQFYETPMCLVFRCNSEWCKYLSF